MQPTHHLASAAETKEAGREDTSAISRREASAQESTSGGRGASFSSVRRRGELGGKKVPERDGANRSLAPYLVRRAGPELGSRCCCSSPLCSCCWTCPWACACICSRCDHIAGYRPSCWASWSVTLALRGSPRRESARGVCRGRGSDWDPDAENRGSPRLLPTRPGAELRSLRGQRLRIGKPKQIVFYN